jgi:hypothetical protein
MAVESFTFKAGGKKPYNNNKKQKETPYTKKKTWSKQKELKECDLVLSAYKNNLGKPLYIAKDKDVKYWRYIKPEEFIQDNLNKRHIDDIPVYTYGHGTKRYLNVFVSGSSKNLGKEYYGYDCEDSTVDENSPYSNERIFICWKEDLINQYEKWNEYCMKIVEK